MKLPNPFSGRNKESDPSGGQKSANRPENLTLSGVRNWDRIHHSTNEVIPDKDLWEAWVGAQAETLREVYGSEWEIKVDLRRQIIREREYVIKSPEVLRSEQLKALRFKYWGAEGAEKEKWEQHLRELAVYHVCNFGPQSQGYETYVGNLRKVVPWLEKPTDIKILPPHQPYE